MATLLSYQHHLLLPSSSSAASSSSSFSSSGPQPCRYININNVNPSFAWVTPHLRASNSSSSSSKRRCWRRTSIASNLQTFPLDEPAIMELPCLPFNPAEVFIPTATKTLHLYEARFLALLEEAMQKYNNFFAHIVIERVSDEVEEGVLSIATKYGCLARIESVRRMDVGALVTIRGVGRVTLAKLTQLEPFLKGNIIPVLDEASTDAKEMSCSVERLKSVLSDVQQLQIKLRTSKDELLQTPLENSLQWVQNGLLKDIASSFVPSKAESISFAALQPVAGASAKELLALLQERLEAMEVMDTFQRLQKVTKHAEENRASLAAKVALQSLRF